MTVNVNLVLAGKPVTEDTCTTFLDKFQDKNGVEVGIAPTELVALKQINPFTEFKVTGMLTCEVGIPDTFTVISNVINSKFNCPEIALVTSSKNGFKDLARRSISPLLA